MPTGRHARDISAPADLSSTLEPPTAATTLEVHLATPTGLRRPLLENSTEATGTGRRRRVEAASGSVALAEHAPAIAPGAGRRRKPATPVAEAPAFAVVPVVTGPVDTQAPAAAGTGRRRKATPAVPAIESVVESVVEIVAPVEPRATIAPGSGRRRMVATPPTAPSVPVVAAAPIAAAPPADVIPIEAGSRSRSASRHRGRSNSPVPGNPALVAGAAAVAIAAVGAVATTGGIQLGAAGTQVASASTLAVAHLPKAAPTDQNAARASRDKARDVLALRLQEQAKQSALAKALKLAQLRASRLAALAKDFFLPVHSYRLTAAFGEGGGLWSHGHTGQDFACPSGTPIHALSSGVIISSGWDGPYGWKTVERLPDGTEIWYAHQSKILVHSGPVVAGQLIGLVGSTGNTTGPHLHLEVHPQGGPAVDPMPWLRAHGMHP